MKKINKLSGNLIINPEENVAFECSVFENAIIDANYGNVKFMNCTFLNDICIKNAKNITIYMSTILFDSSNKRVSAKIFGDNIDMEYVYVNDMKGNSVVKCVSENIETRNLVFDSVNERESSLDIIANTYKVDTSLINVRKNFSMKDNIEEINSKVKRVTKNKKI